MTLPRGEHGHVHDAPPDGHLLCNLSYFEFYRPPCGAFGQRGVYIHKYPVASKVDACPLTSLLAPPVDASRKPRLFRGITATDVRNLIASLENSTPLTAGEGASYGAGDFVFGFDDVLGWLLRVNRTQDGTAAAAASIPDELRTSAAIAAYINGLEVVGCALVTGAASGAREWQLTIELPEVAASEIITYTAPRGQMRQHLYCRSTPMPQRTLDVVPLILMLPEGTLWTTVSRRRGPVEQIDSRDVAMVGCTSRGRDLIVGAGEHVETTDMIPELVDMQLAGAQRHAPVFQQGRALRASRRALREEVGLTSAAISRARLWLIGQHRIPASAAIARDLRYWPRAALDAAGEPAPVLYGYRRETSTIVHAAVLHLDEADDASLRPTDTGEIDKATLVPWHLVVQSFREAGLGEGLMRPAFGWAHEEMVRCVDEHAPQLVAAYREELRGHDAAAGL
jgi:hypothetical protein